MHLQSDVVSCFSELAKIQQHNYVSFYKIYLKKRSYMKETRSINQNGTFSKYTFIEFKNSYVLVH